MNNVKITPVLNDTMLALLETQRENFYSLAEFIKTRDLRPSRIFLPQTLKMIDAEFNAREDLISDCIDYLDVVKIYSITIYGDGESFLEEIKQNIINNRTVSDYNGVLSKEILDDFIFNSKEEAKHFLDNNKLLVALYLYSLVNLIFYTES